MSRARAARPPRGPEGAGPCPGRGAPVVHAVLEATLDELGLVGYGALSVEQVATRAGVNKTTVYRRWPTKAALVERADGCLYHAKRHGRNRSVAARDLKGRASA